MSARGLPVLNDASPAGQPPRPGRRQFLRTAAGGAALAALSACGVEDFLRRNYRELSKQDLSAILERLERRYSEQYGKKVRVGAEGPMQGVDFAYGLDLSRCIGCRRCVYACVKENNQSRRNPQIHWIKVLEMDKSRGVDLAHANAYYESELVPRPGHFYMPVQCQQCRHPPCTKVCPVKATWKEPDGIVVIDYDWCIGCRCCTAACPYGARKFNWAEPDLPKEEMNPDTHYLGNRPRMKGVVEKCTFCIQRTRNGRYPACVEICPVGARKFGNLLDEQSEIRRVMETKRVFVFKEDLATEPQFYYFYAT
ncbi:MAG TPA: 4Fe-4S dicluster domain-containing protein [Anaeromyxobacteraceae bacterium]|nr:4Fe-4S dicluster domain-containing protein [Anaeromyxobacteraceae bacterium]